MTTQYPAVIFDLDGTLADTLQDLANATNWGLSQLGQPPHPLESYRYLVGAGRRELCVRALPKNRQDLVEKLIPLMTEYYTEHCFDVTQPYAGIEHLLSRLTERRVRMAVLSNKPQPFVELTMTRLFGKFRFDAVVGDRDDLPRKPDPAGALQIAAGFALSPDKIAYVGDTSIDMQTANRAGMFAIGVSWGFRDRAELLEHGARAIVDSPAELFTLIAG